MRLSKTVEQACCILSILAEHHGQPVTNVELNERMNVSQSYLTKITRKLVISGIITSAQGVKGGFVLAQPMASIKLGEVVKATDGSAPFFRPKKAIIYLMLPNCTQVVVSGYKKATFRFLTYRFLRAGL